MEYIKDGEPFSVQRRDFRFAIVEFSVIFDENLNGMDKLIYMALCAFSNQATSACFPSVATLCKITKLSRNSAKKSLKALQDNGYLTIVNRKSGKLNETNLYILTGKGNQEGQGVGHQVTKGRASGDQGVGHQVTKGRASGDPELEPINKNNNNYINIVEYLNEKAGTSYKPSSSVTQNLIDQRLEDGFTIEDFKKVIDNKVKDWKGDLNERYLRPSTLFGDKFEGYLNQKDTKQQENKNTVIKKGTGKYDDIYL